MTRLGYGLSQLRREIPMKWLVPVLVVIGAGCWAALAGGLAL